MCKTSLSVDDSMVVSPMASTMMTAQADDEALGARLVQRLNEAAMALMMSVGHRTGLFDVMADMPPSTITQIAQKAELSERYVREWLGAMTVDRIVVHDPLQRTYHLPPQHAALLTRAATPNNMAGMFQWMAVLGSVEDDVVEAFRHGKGVPYDRYRRFHEVMAEESAQTVVAGLDAHILPLVPGLVDRLTEGIDVLDIGCGAGAALLHMAGRFPNSRFVGYDLSADAISMAWRATQQRRLGNSRFEVMDLAAMKDADRYDLVTAFDVIHDQAKPDVVLTKVRAALRAGGTFLMQDLAACSHHHGNMDHPIGPFLYTISCMHCMSVSLAQGGPGLGAAWGRELALQMLRDAGWRDIRVHRLDHDFQNDWYVMHK